MRKEGGIILMYKSHFIRFQPQVSITFLTEFTLWCGRKSEFYSEKENTSLNDHIAVIKHLSILLVLLFHVHEFEYDV